MDLQDLASVEFNRGKVFTLTGPMRAEKSLQAILLENKINTFSPYRALVVTNDLNTRDLKKEESPKIKSASGLESPATIIKHENPMQLLEVLEQENNRIVPDSYGKKGKVDVLFIEECNFFDSSFPEVIERIRLNYPKLMIVLIGLNYNFKQENFGIMGWANSSFIKIETQAHCNILKEDGNPCGELTRYTARLVNFKKINGYCEEPVDVADKFGNKILNTFCFDPIFAPTVISEEKDLGKDESEKTRIYTVACITHFQLPFKKEAVELEIFIKKHLRVEKTNLTADMLRYIFDKTPYLDQILRYLTEEKGIKYHNGVFSLRKYSQGIAYGNYLIHPEEEDSGVYLPEIKKELL